MLISDHIQAHEKLMEIYPCLKTKTAFLMLVRTCKKLEFNIDGSVLEKFDKTREWLRENTPWRNGPSKDQREKSRKAHLERHIGKGCRLYHKGDVEIRALTQLEWDRLEAEGWTHGRSPRIQNLVTEGVRKRCSSFKGTVLLKRGNEKIRVPVCEAKILVQQDWQYNNKGKSTKGTTYVTNLKITKRIEMKELAGYLELVWYQGIAKSFH